MPNTALVNGVVITIAANTPYAIPPGAYRVLSSNALTFSTTFGGAYAALTGATAEPGAYVSGGWIQSALSASVILKKINTAKRNFSGLVGNRNVAAYWRQNEQFGAVLYDSINQRHMTKPAGVTLNQPGIVTNALSALYDGASSPSVLSDPLNNLTALTVEAIIKNPAFSVGHEMIWSNDGTATYLSTDQLGKLVMSLRLGAIQHVTRAVPAMSNDTWYHVAGAWSTGEQIRLYINGAEVAVDDSSVRTGNLAPAGTMYLGSFGGGSLFWSGYMADVAVYSRRLLPYEIFERAQARLSIW